MSMFDPQTIIPTSPISQEEEIAGATLSSAQIKLLCNIRAGIATEKLYLSLDSSVPTSYMQNEAYLRGKLDMLNLLLTSHLEATQVANQNQ